MGENSDQKSAVYRPVALTIANSDQIRAELISTMSESDAVEVDCADLGDIDLCGIQLLISARKAAENWGKHFRLARPADGPLLDALRRGGFLPATPSDDDPAKNETAPSAEEQFWTRSTLQS